MAAPYCAPCEIAGKAGVTAHYIVGKPSTPLCPRHMKKWEAAGSPQAVDARALAAEQETTTVTGQPKAASAPPKPNSHSRARREIDMEAFRADIDAGMSISKLAVKHGISEATVYNRKREIADNAPRPKPRTPKAAGRPVRTAAASALSYHDVLADLRARRAKIDAAIAAVEELATAI